MSPDPDPFDEPANLRLLRRLVVALMVVMILGMITITTLMVLRYTNRPLPLPETIVLPDGASAQAFTRGRGWYAVVTDDDRILIFDATTGALRQDIPIE